jgi:hypothetical protein
VLEQAVPETAGGGGSDPGGSDASGSDATAADPGERASSAGRRVPVPLVAAIAGVIVGGGVVVLLVILGVIGGDRENPNASDDLVSAFERSRFGVYAVDGEFRRTLPDGRELVSGALVVQRPPDELRRQLGGMSGRVNGRRVNCSTAPDGRFTCAPGAEVADWNEQVAREVANLRSYFDPEHPVYEASDLGDGCFELTLVASLPDPPYGERAVMCYDAASGAMRSIEVRHPGRVVDRLDATVIRGIRPEDFSFEGNAAFEGRTEGG